MCPSPYWFDNLATNCWTALIGYSQVDVLIPARVLTLLGHPGLVLKASQTDLNERAGDVFMLRQL
jgi:hypothetical protein